MNRIQRGSPLRPPHLQAPGTSFTVASWSFKLHACVFPGAPHLLRAAPSASPELPACVLNTCKPAPGPRSLLRALPARAADAHLGIAAGPGASPGSCLGSAGLSAQPRAREHPTRVPRPCPAAGLGSSRVAETLPLAQPEDRAPPSPAVRISAGFSVQPELLLSDFGAWLSQAPPVRVLLWGAVVVGGFGGGVRV